MSGPIVFDQEAAELSIMASKLRHLYLADEFPVEAALMERFAAKLEVLSSQRDEAQARAEAAEKLAPLVPPALTEHNRWLPGEKGRSGVYADDNCDGDFLRVFADSQGDVYLSMWGTRPMMSVRMVGNCTRRPHVLNAARRLAEALQQDALAQAGEGQ